MAKLKIADEWWTAPTEADNGRLVLVTGRDEMEAVKASGIYRYRVEVTWPYPAVDDGMPANDAARLMEQVHDALLLTLSHDPVAVMTGVFTGDGQRDWVFYARSLPLFQKKFNEALDPFPDLPLSFYAEDDPQWLAYDEMCASRVSADD